MMHFEFLEVSLEDWINQILVSCQITSTEVNQLMLLLSSQVSLTEDQRAMIQRVFYGLRHGLLHSYD
jgi:hypothetical protein